MMLDLAISSTKKTVTIDFVKMEERYEVAKNTPVTLSKLKANLKFLVVDGVPIGVLTVVPEMEKLNAYIDLDGQHVDFTIGRKSVCVGLKRDRITDRFQEDKSEDEYFTTDSITMPSAEVSKDESEEDMVVDIAMKVSSESNCNDSVGDLELMEQEQTVAEKFSHLLINEKAKLGELLYGEYILAWSLHHLRSAEVPLQHFLR